MNTDHWMLSGLWFLFGLAHSLLAAEWVKAFFEERMGKGFRYYRFLYSVFALVFMLAILWWQFSIRSSPVGSFPVIRLWIGLPAGVVGVVLMVFSIHKYFFHLSGVAVFFRERGSEDEIEGGHGSLETGGFHRYVRHPLYLGTLLFIWALLLFFPFLSNLIACLMITIYTVLGAWLEEQKLLRVFGEQYAVYRLNVPMLVPGFGKRASGRKQQ
ncbi:methyltransferase family protein [Flavitalea flava]